MDNSSYLEIRSLFNKFLKHDYWKKYTAADIFFIHDILKNKDSFLTFIDSFYGDSFGIQFFNNRDGFNYVHDIFTSEAPEYLTVSECDSICAVYVSKSELKSDEIAYLKKRELRIKAENNLIIYRFKKGYSMSLASLSDERKIFKAIELLDSILRNDLEIVDMSFKEDLCAYVDVDTSRLEYTLIPRPLPFLEKISKRKECNLAIVDELSNVGFINDDAYLFTSYLPITIKEDLLRPLAVYLIYPKLNKHYFSYIIDKPRAYSDKLLAIIYDAFTTIGKPVSLTISSRDSYSILANTLKALSIENRVDKNKCTKYDGIHNMLAKFYTEELCDIEISLNEAIELLNSMALTINNSDYDSDDEMDYDIDEDNSNLMVS